MSVLPLRIAILSDAIQNRNGVGSYYQDLREHLAPRVSEITLYCPGQEKNDPMRGLCLPMPGDKTQHIYFPNWRKVSAALLKSKPDVIILPSVGPYTFLGLIYAWRSGAPICVGHHTDFEQLAKLYWNPTIANMCRGVIRTFIGALLRSGQSVVTNSIPMAACARALGAANVRLVGTPLTRNFVQSPTVPVRHELKSVLFLGRLAKEKNIDLVLAAARSLPQIRFVIAGDGPMRDLVEAALLECPNLEYRGWIQRNQVCYTLDECDMLLLPSSVEAFGTVALEAMSRQRLVLVSQACGLRDWPELSRHTFFIESGESLGDAIFRVANEPLSTRMLCAQQGCLAAHAYLEKTVTEWLEILSGLCHKGETEPAYLGKVS